MDKNNDSQTLFKNKLDFASRISTNDLLELLKAMERELMISGNSPLLTIAYLRCTTDLVYEQKGVEFKYSPKNYILPLNFFWSGTCDTPVYDAWMLICGLAEYLQGKDIQPELKKWQPRFSKEEPRIHVEPGDLKKNLEAIEKAVFRARCKAFPQYMNEPPEDMEMAGSNVSKNASSETDALLSEAREQDDAIIVETNQVQVPGPGAVRPETTEPKRSAEISSHQELQIEESLDKLRCALMDTNDRIRELKNSILEFGRGETIRQLPETAEPNCPAEISPRQELRIEDSLAELRSALMDTNAQMRKLEDSILESGRDETIRQLLELYNLIADSRDSALELDRKTKKMDPQGTARNLNEFLKMIAGFMSSYGVTVHTGAPGDPFNTKTQEVRYGPAQYDPKSAVISASLRSGFVQGDMVRQKEWVQLK